jgi:hypothetical protein
VRDRALLLAGMIRDPARRSYALELLEVCLSPDVKNRVMPLVDVQSPAERLARLGLAAAHPPLDPIARCLTDRAVAAASWPS